MIEGLPASLHECFTEPEALKAIAEWQDENGDHASGCRAEFNSREYMLARVLDRLVGERDIYKRAQDRAFIHGQERWDDGYACAKGEHASARTEWVRASSALVEEMGEMGGALGRGGCA
jgi:hypothetical protein